MLSERLVWKTKNNNGFSSKIDGICESPKQQKLIEGISPVIQKLLASRGILEADAVERFLNPDLTHLHDPFLLPDMDKAAKRIRRAMKNGEQIWVYGDYDVDGITSISILMKYFEHEKVPARYYIPNRMDEGYGLNAEAVEHIASQGCDVLITVDCGITSVKEAQTAKKCNIDLIITDHHECPEILPEAYALINPKRKNSLYPYEMLAGAGVAYKLALACTPELESSTHDELLMLAAIGTIADIAPLTGENRVVAKFGLDLINNVPFLGLKQLIDKCGLADKKITAGHIGYFLAPKINAAGRIGDPEMGVRLLLGHDLNDAAQTALALVTLNEERQFKEREVLEACFKQIETEKLNQKSIIIVHGEGFHSGIIGIVASRIVERYYRPVVVLSIDLEQGMAKGSARSIDGISIYEALDSARNLYEKFGGHDMAAGLSFKVEHLEAFKAAMVVYADDHISKEDLCPILKIEDELGPKDIDYRLMDQLEHLEPFGAANPKPVFALKNLSVEAFRRMGKGEEHIKITVSDGDRIYDAVAFNVGEAYAGLQQREVLDLAFTLEKNSFKGIDSIQMMIKDLRRGRLDPAKEQLFEFQMGQSWFENAINSGHFDIDQSRSKSKGVASVNLTADSTANLVSNLKLEAFSKNLHEKKSLILCGSMRALNAIYQHCYDDYFKSMGFESPWQHRAGDSAKTTLTSKPIQVVVAPILKRLPNGPWDQIIFVDFVPTKQEFAQLLLAGNAANDHHGVGFDAGRTAFLSVQLPSSELDQLRRRRLVPDRDVLVRVYKHLKAAEGLLLKPIELCQTLAISTFTLAVSLCLMENLEMLEFTMSEDTLRFSLLPVTGKMNLNETEAYKAVQQYKIMQE